MKLFKFLSNLAVGSALMALAIAPVPVEGQIKNTLTKSDPNWFPELVNADIKGAPKLGKPHLVVTANNLAMAEGMGWGASTFWDWDQDGQKDLLIGEFGSGLENGRSVGNFIRVYKNIGTAVLPKFADDFFYAYTADDELIPLKSAKHPEQYPKHLVNYGTPISIPQFCCMCIKPQFADLNGDGFPDLYSGRYSPGEVYWFRGSELGFLPGEKVKQFGDPGGQKKYEGALTDPEVSQYWSYSAVAFGEFNDKGLQDMIVGGHAGLRISKNVGTKTAPEFGIRTLLLQPDGTPVTSAEDTSNHPFIPIVVDWDQDGVLDILTSNAYVNKGNAVVLFFKGVKVNGEYRFEKGKSLFDAKNNAKTFPGEWLSVSVTDWNNDGVNDLLITTKVVLLEGKFNKELNWSWNEAKSKFESLSQINPGYYSTQEKKEIDEKIRFARKTEAELGKEEMKKRRDEVANGYYEKYTPVEELMGRYYGGKEEYKSLIHKGYVYLMLGEKK